MAQQIKKKFIADDAIDGSKLKLLEGEAVRLQTPAGEVELLKKDAQGKLVSEGEEISFKDDMEAHVESVRSSLQSNIDAEESARIADVDAEESRAMGVESSLQSQITQEISDRQADVDAEQSRAEGVEASLQSQLTQEISDRQSEVTRVEGLLSTEESARIAGDLNLQNQIDNVLSNIDPTALDSLTEIVAAFQEADGSLQGAISTLAGNSSGNISAEQSRAEAAEASLQAQINQEISDRQADVDAEESRAMGVESSLQSQIMQEISDRMADVDAEESRAMGVEGSLQSQITQEISDRQADVDAEESRAMLVEGSLQSQLTQEISDRIADVDSEESRAMGVESSLQSQISQEISDRMADVDAEQSRAEGVEASLQAQITQEVSDRQSAVSAEESARIAEDLTLVKLNGSRAMTGALSMGASSTSTQLVAHPTESVQFYQTQGYTVNSSQLLGTGIEPVDAPGMSSTPRAYFILSSDPASPAYFDISKVTFLPNGVEVATVDPANNFFYERTGMPNSHSFRFIVPVTGGYKIYGTIGLINDYNLNSNNDPFKIHLFQPPSSLSSTHITQADQFDSSTEEIKIFMDYYGLVAHFTGGSWQSVDSSKITDLTIPTGYGEFKFRSKVEVAGTLEYKELQTVVTGNSYKITNLASGVLSSDAVNKGQLDSAIALEEIARIATDSSLQSQITQEISDRQADVNAEESRAMGVESGLDSRLSTAESDINSLEGRMDEAESDISVLQSQIFNTGSDLSGVDARLTTAENDIDSLESNLSQEISNRQADVDAEQSRAEGVEASLQSQITQEVSDREAMDSSLLGLINQEAQFRLEGDQTEASLRFAADQSLQSQIDNVLSNLDPAALDSLTEIVAAFQSADSSLQGAISTLAGNSSGNIEAEESRAMAVEASLQSQITQEISDRIADVDAEQSRAEGVEASLQSQITQEISDRIADVDAEESRAMVVESSLQSQISQEISDRQAAISSEASSRSAEDLTFVKLDGSRNMTGGLTIANPSHVGTIQIGEEDDTLKLNYVDSANLYGGGTFTTALYSGAVDITHSSGRNSFLSDTGLNVTGNGNVSAVSSGGVSVNNGANGRVTLGQGAVSIFDGATGTNPKMPTQNYHATPKKYVDDEINAEESRALAVEGSLQSQISQEISDRMAAVSAEESARIAEDLTFFKKDGSREMTGSIIPSVTLSFDIGSPTKRFKDIYLSGNTIDLGGVTLSNESSEFVVRDASNNELAIVSDNVREGSVNKFFLESRVQETEMSMLDVTKSGEVVSTDSLVDAVSKLQNQMTQEISDRQDDVDTEESRALAAEGLLDGRLDVLEALAFEKESFTLGVNPTGVTLAHSPKAKSTVMFVGRLALHEGLDYSISGNQVTFIGDFAYDSEDEIAAAEGDVVKVTYYY